MSGLKQFAVADYLGSEEMITEYLSAALEDENPDVFFAAVSDVAKARGMTAIANITGLGRERLYKALTPGAKPRYETIIKVLHGLGVRLTVQPCPPDSRLIINCTRPIAPAREYGR